MRAHAVGPAPRASATISAALIALAVVVAILLFSLGVAASVLLLGSGLALRLGGRRSRRRCIVRSIAHARIASGVVAALLPLPTLLRRGVLRVKAGVLGAQCLLSFG